MACTRVFERSSCVSFSATCQEEIISHTSVLNRCLDFFEIVIDFQFRVRLIAGNTLGLEKQDNPKLRSNRILRDVSI